LQISSRLKEIARAHGGAGEAVVIEQKLSAVSALAMAKSMKKLSPDPTPGEKSAFSLF